MSNEVREIKDRLSVDEVVAEYVPLKKAGQNFKACCPFHNEKTPSFVVSPQKQIWHCFGCNKGGDIFSFVQEIEGVDFAESLRILARKAGVTLRRANPQMHNEKNRLMQITELAGKFFHAQLLKSNEAGAARIYLKNRQVTKESVLDFKIGYSLESWNALWRFLKERKFRDEEIEKAGIIIKKEKKVGYYDRFRGRLMFPIRNTNGEVVGFGGRTLEKDFKGAKYINSPQSLVYNKSKEVYGLFEGKQAIKEAGYAIVVEGYMDVIMNHQAGIKNVVASSGTAFTEQQLKMIQRYTNTLLFSFDQDAAGQGALLRGVEIALQHGINIKVITIPDGFGKDPDECIKKDPAVWKQAIADAQQIFEYYIDQSAQEFQQKPPQEQGGVIDFMLHLLVQLPHKIEQASWLKIFARKIGVDLPLLQEALAKVNAEREKNEKRAQKAQEYQQKNNKQAVAQPAATLRVKTNAAALMKKRQQKSNEQYKKLFGLLFLNPSSLTFIAEQLEPKMLDDDFFRVLYKLILNFYNKNDHLIPVNDAGEFDYSQFLAYIFEQPHDTNEEFRVFSQEFKHDQLAQSFDRLVLFAQSLYADFDNAKQRDEIRFIVERAAQQYIKRRIEEISSALDTETDPQKIQTLSEEFNRLVNYYK